MTGGVYFFTVHIRRFPMFAPLQLTMDTANNAPLFYLACCLFTLGLVLSGTGLVMAVFTIPATGQPLWQFFHGLRRWAIFTAISLFALGLLAHFVHVGLWFATHDWLSLSPHLSMFDRVMSYLFGVPMVLLEALLAPPFVLGAGALLGIYVIDGKVTTAAA